MADCGHGVLRPNKKIIATRKYARNISLGTLGGGGTRYERRRKKTRRLELVVSAVCHPVCRGPVAAAVQQGGAILHRHAIFLLVSAGVGDRQRRVHGGGLFRRERVIRLAALISQNNKMGHRGLSCRI